jgi:hypothetical protein
MELDDILFRANSILAWSGRTTKPLDTLSVSELMGLLHTSGLGALWHRNPMGLLAVSSNRNPRDPLDRVYGIIQTPRSQLPCRESGRPYIDPRLHL